MEPVIEYAETRDGVRIAFYAMGEGPAMVLMPPLLLRNIRKQWGLWPSPDRQIARSLMEQGRCFVQFDPRGMGLSSPVEELTLDALALDLEAVVDHLELETFDLTAVTYSCPVAIAYVVQHPGRVRKLALGQPFVREFDALMTMTGRALRTLRDREYDVYVDTANHIIERGDKASAERSAALMRATGPETLDELFAMIGEIDLAPMLPEVRAETLVYCPREEGLIATSQCREVAAGIAGAKLVISDERFQIVAGRFLGTLKERAPSNDGLAGTTAERPAGLSAREVEVLRLIAAGRTNREIAEALVISINTVDRHVSHILAKTNTANRAEAASFAIRQGLTE